MKFMRVENCQECPFVQYDGDWGYKNCALTSLKLDKFEEMPSDKVHEQCPLKEGEVVVKLNK